MVQQIRSSANGPNEPLNNAREAFKRIRAGIRLTVEKDYGDYTETITELVAALREHGIEGVNRAYTVLKRASTEAAELEEYENPYPLDLHLDDAQIQYIDKLPYTDFGQAEALAYCYSERLRYAVGLGWLVWSGLRWQIDTRRAHVQIAAVVARARQEAVLKRSIPEGDKEAEAKKIADLRTTIRSESITRLDAAVRLAETHPALVIDVNDLDQDPYLMGVKNGILNLRTGRLSPPDPSLLITKRNDIDYIPDALCPRWDKFLEEVFEGDQDLIAYFDRVLGYSLTGLTSEQSFFVHYGIGNNGKGTMTWIMSLLAGEYYNEADPKVFERKKDSGTGEELAALRGARLVVTSETDDGYHLNESRIKAITGEDAISCRNLYGHRFTYRPKFKVHLQTNHKPGIKGHDDGVWRRPKLLPYKVSFKGREDRTLKSTLRNELPGILARAVRGAIAYCEQGLGVAKVVIEETEAYRKEMDVIGMWIEECTVEHVGGRLYGKDAYNSYEEWCKDSGLSAMSKKRLTMSLKDRGWIQDSAMHDRYWVNRLKRVDA